MSFTLKLLTPMSRTLPCRRRSSSASIMGLRSNPVLGQWK